MNSKGLYDIEHGYKVAEMIKNGDEKRLINGKKMADICVKGTYWQHILNIRSGKVQQLKRQFI